MNMPFASRRSPFAIIGVMLSLTAITCTMQSASANPAAVTYYSVDPAKWGTPLSWQLPAYPKALLEQKVTGKVDVLLNVSPEGRMTDVVALRSDPVQPAFEESVREAVRQWTFTKAMNEACKPVATQSRLQVTFEMVNGKPKVDVGAASAAKIAGRERIEELNRAEVMKALADNYPRDARRMGKMGEVHALLRVDARTGATKSVDIVEVFADNSSYNPEPKMIPTSGFSRSEPRSSPPSIQFSSVAREELEALRFKPVADAGQDTITVCREVIFRMQGLKPN